MHFYPQFPRASASGLLQRVRGAAEEALMHAELVGRLAHARGGRACARRRAGTQPAQPLAIALEDAVEGCIRECWGALCVHHQAQAARSRLPARRPSSSLRREFDTDVAPALVSEL